MTDKELRQGHRFRACKVGEPETEHAATKAHPDGVTQREVFGIGGFTPVGDRGGITPASHPFVMIVCHTVVGYRAKVGIL